jgi:hypothetical protein
MPLSAFCSKAFFYSLPYRRRAHGARSCANDRCDSRCNPGTYISRHPGCNRCAYDRSNVCQSRCGADASGRPCGPYHVP